jgi:hypothetical protein
MRFSFAACLMLFLCTDVDGSDLDGPELAPCTPAQLAKHVLCRDHLLVRTAGEALVERAFAAKDFTALDRLYDTWSKGIERFPDGRWKLSTFRTALSALFEREAAASQHLTTIQAWQQTRTTSFAAKFIEALYWRDVAWQARGHGFARDVSKEAWASFDARLDKAEAILRALEPRATTYPDWYVLRINLLTDRSKRSTVRARDVFAEGTRHFPEYHDLYFAAARGAEPNWNGSAADYEAFANEAAGIAENFEGVGMYARIYARVDEPYRMPFDPARSNLPTWQRLQAGYDALLRRYPSSLWLTNQYASVACRANAGDVYRRLREAIGTRVENEVFGVVSVQECDRRHHWSNLLPER